jgi:hypothetical protein
MSKRERRTQREQTIGQMRALVRGNVRRDRIDQTQAEAYRLAEQRDHAGLTALMESERGRELGAFNSRRGDEPVATPAQTAPAAPRNSYWQEAILEALADGRHTLTRDIFKRLGETKPTAARRAAISRSLQRLQAKGLIDAFVIKDRMLQGKGYLWRLRQP